MLNSTYGELFCIFSLDKIVSLFCLYNSFFPYSIRIQRKASHRADTGTSLTTENGKGRAAKALPYNAKLYGQATGEGPSKNR